MSWHEPETHEGNEFDGEAWFVENNRTSLVLFRQRFPKADLNWTKSLSFEQEQEVGEFATVLEYFEEAISWIAELYANEDLRKLNAEQKEVLLAMSSSARAIWVLVEEFVNSGKDSKTVRDIVMKHYEFQTEVLRKFLSS